MRRRPAWKAHVTGGVYTIEITHNALTGQWHPHLHAIIDGRFYPHSELLRDWQDVVRDQAGADIRAVRGIRKLANYLAAYVAKSCDLDALDHAQLPEWAIETHGLRLAQTFGSLQACKPQTADDSELDPLPIRHVDLDVHELAYDAFLGNLIAGSLLRILEPHRSVKHIPEPGFILGLIRAYWRTQKPQQGPDPPNPRDRDQDQLRLS